MLELQIKGGKMKKRPISAYNQVPFFFLMCSPICVLCLVIQDFIQEALFSKIQVIRTEWGNYV